MKRYRRLQTYTRQANTETCRKENDDQGNARSVPWHLDSRCLPSRGPTEKLLLFWTGTLIRFAAGFCVAFNKASTERDS